MIVRKRTREVQLGNVKVGNLHKVTVQSMTNTVTSDAKATLEQISRLQQAGCEIVRVSVPDTDSALALREITSHAQIPVIADIHFDYRLAIAAMEHGVHGLRLNPGNIGSEDRIKQVVLEAKKRSLPIRIGVNAGSLERDLLDRYGSTKEAMVKSAFRHIEILERYDFYDTVVSLKASDVFRTVEAYEYFSSQSDYPLHLGVTEAGTLQKGTIKSAIGIGALLLKGIGDTLRVSLTADPVEEIYVGKEILRALDLDQSGIRIVSCPTCARTGIDLIALAERIEKKTEHIEEPLTVAIMGCVVNGPGEAKEADIGMAGGDGKAVLFAKGEILYTCKEEDIEKRLLEEIQKRIKGSE